MYKASCLDGTILKCAWDLFQSSIVRHTDMETIVLKEKGYTYKSSNTGGMAHHAGPHGEGPESVKRQKWRGKNMAQRLYWDSLGKKLQKKDRVLRSIRFWVVWRISAGSGLWGWSLVVWDPALGWHKQGDSGLVCASLIKEIVGNVASSGWLVCIAQVHLQR